MEIERRVGEIIADVRARGDAAVLDYTAQYDGVSVKSVSELELPRAMLKSALAGLPRAQRDALAQASARIRKYHQRQVAKSWQYTEADGTILGQRVTPLDRVGVYVPGGKAAYPSSVLMNAIPAKIAGVRELVMCVPTPRAASATRWCSRRGARRCGSRVHHRRGASDRRARLRYRHHRAGGQDRRPGNAYVTEAKRRVFGAVGIDMISGPTEILVICDGTSIRIGSPWTCFRRLSTPRRLSPF